MLDLYFIIAVIVCIEIAIPSYDDYLFEEEPNILSPKSLVVVVLLGAIYFTFREVLQMFALLAAGFFGTWKDDSTNSIDVICILIMHMLSIVMLTGVINRDSSPEAKEAFRSFSALSSGFLFLLVFSLLKRVFLPFVVFVLGLNVVDKNLFGFLIALGITITAFAMMFFMVFSGSRECGKNRAKALNNHYENCSKFCSSRSSWVEVYNMILGNY